MFNLGQFLFDNGIGQNLTASVLLGIPAFLWARAKVRLFHARHDEHVAAMAAIHAHLGIEPPAPVVHGRHAAPQKRPIMDWIKNHWRTITAIIGAVATVVWSSYSDGHISAADWVQIGTATATAVMVYLVPIFPEVTYIRTITTAILGGLGLLASYLVAGDVVTSSQWINVVLVVMTGLGIHVITVNKVAAANAAAEPLPPVEPGK